LTLSLALHFEQLANGIDNQLEQLTRLLDVQLMSVMRLQDNLEQEWYFMDSAPLFQLDNIIKSSRQGLKSSPQILLRVLAGKVGG
jgi:hypothetical protein